VTCNKGSSPVRVAPRHDFTVATARRWHHARCQAIFVPRSKSRFSSR